MLQPNLSISNFKGFLLKILLPVVIVLIIVSFTFAFWVEKKLILGANTIGAYKVNRIITENVNNEIPIFGSSRAEGGYIPSLLGDNYFNYGMSGIGSNVMLFFLREECNKKDKTAPIIINFDLAGIFNARGDLSNYLYNSTYPPLRPIFAKDFRFYYQIPILKYYGKYESYLQLYLNDKTNLTKYTDKGANVEKNVMTQQRFNDLVKQREADTMVFFKDAPMMKEYNDIITQHPNRYFIYVVAPYHRSCFNNFPTWTEAKDYLAELDKKDNVKVYDFSQLLTADSFFVNTTHVNYQGAVAFSKVLRDSLENLKR